MAGRTGASGWQEILQFRVTLSTATQIPERIRKPIFDSRVCGQSEY